MEEYVKKYFWTLGIVVVLASSVFAAKAVNHILEARLLADRAKVARPSPPKRVVTRTRTATARRSKLGDPLAKRNMFCSECKPAEPDTTEPVAAGDGSLEPLTTLPLRLIATNVSTIGDESFATIRNTETKHQGSYWLSSKIPNAGPIKKITPNYVVFLNDESRRNERIALFAKEQPKTTPRKRPVRKPRGRRGELMAMMDEGIKKISDNQYEIDRNLVDTLLKSPGMAARGARIVPSVRNGKPNGIKLYAIRPSSIYAKLGLRNGDTISSINGFPITTSPDKALELYTKLKSSSNISISVIHRGKSRTVNYSIR